jgi:hypothetical protein
MTPCSLGDRNQHFRGICYLHLPDVILKMEAARPFKMLVPISQTTRRHIAEDYAIFIAVRMPILDACTFAFHYTTLLFQLQHRSQCHIVAVESTTVRTPCHEMLIIPGSLTWPKNCCVWSSNVGACAVKAMTTATLSYVLSLRKQILMLFAAYNERRFLTVKQHYSNQAFSSSYTS